MSTADRSVVSFLGLEDLTAPSSQPAFPLGVLYPYTPDLLRVCAAYSAAARQWPDAAEALVGGEHSGFLDPNVLQADAARSYVDAIATLRERIAFAPGAAGDSVTEAYRQVMSWLMGQLAERREG